jgi:hypothetical protein
MPAYSHLLDEERDQIAIMRAAGHSICAIAGALHERNPPYRGNCDATPDAAERKPWPVISSFLKPRRRRAALIVFSLVDVPGSERGKLAALAVRKD